MTVWSYTRVSTPTSPCSMPRLAMTVLTSFSALLLSR